MVLQRTAVIGMLDKEQFDEIAKQWIEQNLKGREAQESLASYLQQMYRHGVVDTAGKIRHITKQLSEIGISTNV